MTLSSWRDNLGKFIFLGGGTILVVVVVFTALNFGVLFLPPELIQSNPADGSDKITPFTTVTFEFNQSMSQDNRSAVTASPEIGGTVSVSDQLIQVTPTKHLTFGQTYTVTIKDPKNSIGRVGKTVAISFTVRTKDQLDSEDIRRLQGESDQTFLQGVSQGQDPTLLRRAQVKESILSQLPYQTDTFKVEYLVDSDVFKITILKNPYDANKQAALDWFTANGVTDLTWFNYSFSSVRGVY